MKQRKLKRTLAILMPLLALSLSSCDIFVLPFRAADRQFERNIGHHFNHRFVNHRIV